MTFGDLPYIPPQEIADLSSMPPVEGDYEIKEVKWIKILTSNKLLARLPVLFAQIKAGNNSYKIKT